MTQNTTLPKKVTASDVREAEIEVLAAAETYADLHEKMATDHVLRSALSDMRIATRLLQAKEAAFKAVSA